jgi:MFS family permease
MAAGRAPVSRAYANYVLGVLFLVYVFNFIDRQILAIMIGPIKEELGVSDTAMGFLVGFAFVVFYSVAGIPIARWADRGSRRNVITLGLTVWSAMTAASGLARSFGQLALARVFVGVGEAAGSPPSHSLISDYFPPERRATALALYANGIYVGAGIAFMLGGYIVTHFDWRVAFYAVGLTGIPLALLVRYTVRELPHGASESEPTAPPTVAFGEVIRFLLARRSFVFLVLAACCQSILGYGILNWGAEFLNRVHGMPRAEIGAWFGPIVLVGGCTGVTLGGWIADRLGVADPRWYVRLPAVLALLATPFALGFLLLEDPTRALGCFAVFYAIANMYVGPMLSTTQNLVRPEMRATASAILLFILNMMGLGAGPFLVGLLNDQLHGIYGTEAIRYSLLLATLVAAMGSVFFWIAGRTLREDLLSRGV